MRLARARARLLLINGGTSDLDNLAGDLEHRHFTRPHNGQMVRQLRRRPK